MGQCVDRSHVPNCPHLCCEATRSDTQLHSLVLDSSVFLGQLKGGRELRPGQIPGLGTRIQVMLDGSCLACWKNPECSTQTTMSAITGDDTLSLGSQG